MKTQLEAVYRPLLDEFVKELAKYPNADYAGIPHPFLPEVGRNYDHALKRIAVVGKETRGWGPNLDSFIPDYLTHGFNFAAEMAEFQNLDFKDPGWMGGRPTRASFWGFWMNVLAKTYGIQSWKEIQNGKYDILLDSFVWGNANAIETYTSEGVDADAPGYQRAKALSERLFDSIDQLVRATAPHAVILLCSVPERNRYLGPDFRVVESIDDKVTVFRRGDLLVFHAPHPNNQRWYAGGADTFAQIIRDLLAKNGLFCPLPDVLDNGLLPQAKKILVKECTGIHKFEAIAKVAHGLRQQHSYMTARDLCLEILNPAGHRTNRGTPFTGNTQGPCRLVATAWNHFQNTLQRTDIAEDIALSFTDIYGNYAYE